MASIIVPEELYVRLAAEAEREGLTLDELLAMLLSERELQETMTNGNNGAVEPEYDPATDPLMRLAGSIRSGDSSWAERHDGVTGDAEDE